MSEKSEKTTEYFKETNPDPHLKDSFVVQEKSLKRTEYSPKERSVISLEVGDLDTMEKLDQKVAESYSRSSGGIFSCHYCPKIFKNVGHIREHVELHFDGLVLACNFCDKTVRSRHSLRDHVRKTHNWSKKWRKTHGN